MHRNLQTVVNLAAPRGAGGSRRYMAAGEGGRVKTDYSLEAVLS